MTAMREIERLADGTVRFTLFETPLTARFVPGHEELNKRLAHTILSMEKQPQRYQDKRRWNTKFGALFESTFDFFEQPHPEITELRDHCLAFVYDTVARFNEDFWESAGVDLVQLQTTMESWFHVTRSGGWQGLHKHANNSWSGVYFVRRGTQRDPEEKNGFFRIHDPRQNISMFHDMAMVPFSTGIVDIEPQDGKLIVFPSWLQHEVLPYFGEEPRITVAFNVSIRA
jgi:uncharacterized protein (TIGR02466 family)